MFQEGYKLRYPVDFDNAMFFSVTIEVWQDGTLLDSGKITAHKDEAVFLNNDGGYLKELCDFLVVTSPNQSPRS